jgi:RHS repeat-associated protein
VIKNTLIPLLTGFLYTTIAIDGDTTEPIISPKMLADSDLNIQLLDISAAPNSIVGGAVNVITGSYVNSECDMTLAGSNPLVLQRHFNSGNRKRGTLCHGWDLNFPSNIEVFHPRIISNPITVIIHDRGADLSFKGWVRCDMEINKKQLHYGVTNCSTGVLSSRTNIKNKKFFYPAHYARQCELHEESGEILFYQRIFSEDFASTYTVSKNLLPSGSSILYDYDNKKRLLRVAATGKDLEPLSHIEWLYPKDFKSMPQLTLRSSDGRKVCYKYEKQHSRDDKDHHRYCLKSVIRDHGSEMQYEYRYASKHSMERMVKKNFPDNRYLSVQYYEEGNNKVGTQNVYISNHKDARVGRVSALYAPVGSDATPIMTWAFKYHLQKRHRSIEPIGGNTEVRDALGHRKIYHFSDEHRLTSVEHYLDNGQLYRKENMLWAESGDEETFLLARGFTDADGMLLLRRNYTYDKAGNVLKDTLRGNLTGYNESAIKWNSYSQADKFIKTYSYTDSGLLASQSDERKKEVYHYLPGTDLLTLKLVYGNNEIRERYQYTYDSKGTLVKEICDDGNSQEIDNLSGFTERRIKKIQPTTTQPIGLPGVIEECFRNRATGQEELLMRSENTYSKEGYLLLQKIYDCNNNYCYSKEWKYDTHGNVIQEIDPLGQISLFQYDQNNNRIYQQTPNSAFYTLYSYDYANRLIQEEMIYNEKGKRPCIANSYSYDYMGNRVAHIDRYQNTATFQYDEFGRIVKKIYPSILNSKGSLEYPSDEVFYDGMNNPSRKIDTNGHTTEFKYTVHGKPYYTMHPDGTIEKKFYHPDGLLQKSIDINGVATHYTYDYKGRKIEETKISPNGEPLTKRYWIYNAFHLSAEIDPSGKRTSYQYDAAGRKKCVRKGDSETRYLYDALGRLMETQEKYAYKKYHRTVLKYDHLNRIVRESIKDENDLLYTMKSYKYDGAGNCTHETIHDTHHKSRTVTEYDAEKRPIKVLRPDGSQTMYEYSDEFKNELGQTVAFKKEIDPKGNQSIQVMDASGRLSKEEKKDCFDNLLQRTLYCHDGEGNLTSRVDDLLVDGVLQKSLKIEFEYDSKNREIAVIEAAGETLQKITRKEYHPSGELAKIIKPDGTVIFHEYDHLGRLIEMCSSDGSIHYIYEYDQNDNVIKVHDCVHEMTTQRTIDANNRMISEQLGSGLNFSYRYDPRGRVLKLTLPDETTVEYSYDAVNLRTVTRRNGKNRNSCTYHFNLSGRISEIELPNTLGSIKFTYDSCLRTKRIFCNKWSQTIPKGGYDLCGNLLKVTQEDAAGKLTSSYTYDALHHLITESGAFEDTYSCDSMHNRLRKNGTSHHLNALHQLTRKGKMHYEYDLNGNLSKKRWLNEEITYHYDALDRLIAVIAEDKKTQYLYDSFHRRLKKTTFSRHNDSWMEIGAHVYLYQGDKEIGTLDAQGKVIEMRTLGLGNNGEIGAAALLEINDITLCPVHDFRGNVAALINVKDGNLLESYRFSAYGEEQIFDGHGCLQSTALCPWRFSSKRIDSETGWTFFGRRYYDPVIGRWTTPDPLRFIDGPNLYCFVHNKPMKFLDPDGRWLSELIGDNYETAVNSIYASGVREYGGAEWSAFEAPNYFYYSSKYRVGTPQNDGLGMTFVNGIGNSKQDSMAAAKMYSDMAGGREVLGVHNASYGLFADVIESALGLFGVMTTPSKLVKENWDECWANNNRRVLHLGHSQGMIHTRNTIPSYDEELRHRINVIAVAPAAHLQENDFAKAVHYESTRDFVPMFDKVLKIASLDFAAIENRAPVVMLLPHQDAPLFDHFNDSPTYGFPVRGNIETFFEIIGAVR